jgi:hypothetical protein
MGTERMISKAWHARQGYETCGCGRPQCRKRRADERRRMRRIERREWRREVAAA